KLIYLSMASMPPSPAYYLSTARKKIFPSPQTLTPSLPLIMQTLNYSNLPHNLPIKYQTIKTPKFKHIISPNPHITKHHPHIIQTI
uniref:S49 family peptidase n=1 Tax=Bacillus pumilus TaxID=1408 RepID=UPI0016423FD0